MTNDIYSLSPEVDSIRKATNPKEYTTNPTTNAVDTIVSPLFTTLSNRRKGVNNRRIFFNSTAISNIQTLVTNTVSQIVRSFVQPGSLVDSVISVFDIPPVAILPLAGLAFALYFRNSIEDNIEALFCKYIP